MTATAPTLDPGNWTYNLRPIVVKGVLFVHVPKTAGLAIARAVYGTEGGGHRTISDYYEAFGADAVGSMFSFATVRDPATRVASAYAFLRRGGINGVDRREAAETVDAYSTLEAFVRKGLAHASGHLHFRPQHEFVCHTDGTLGVDYVLRYETLHDDFERVRATARSRSLFRLNSGVSSSAQAAAALSPEARHAIAEVYARDYDVFEYDLPQ